jgi:tetratricopeptide (TPR) repeat protein
MAVVGASIGWVAGDREARRAKAADSFDEAVRQAKAFMQLEKWPEAKSAAERAGGLLDGAGSDPVQQRLLEQLEADLIMAAALEFARLQKADVEDGHFDFKKAGPLFAKAFRAYSLPVLELEPDEAARAIAVSAIREQLLAALIDWYNIQPPAADKKKLAALLRWGDKNRLWGPILSPADQKDGRRLARLAQSVDTLREPPASLLALGEALAETNKQAAVNFLRKAQQRHPGDFWMNHHLAFYLMEMEPPRSEEAIGFYRVTVALRPLSPGVHLNLGGALKDKGQLDEAIAEYREAIRLKKDYAIAHYNLGIALRAKGELDEAIAEYRAAIRLKKDFTLAHINLGEALGRKGRLDEAIAACRQALCFDKDYALAHDNLGVALARNGRLDQAIDEHHKAIRLKRNMASAHFNLGVALCARGRRDEALLEFREAIRLKDNFPQAHHNLGIELAFKGKLDDAIVELRYALRLNKNFPNAHHNLGIALADKGQLDDAIAECREAIRLQKALLMVEPTLGVPLASAHYTLGILLKRKGKLDEAIAEFNEAIRINKDFANAHLDLGLAFSAKGQKEKAIAEYREAIRIKVDFPIAYYSLGKALGDKGQIQEAIAAYGEAIRLKKDYPEAHCNLGLLLLGQGRFADARRYLRRGHELGSKDPRWANPSAQWVEGCERLLELDGKLPAILNGQKQPADPAERLALADLCQMPCKKLYAAATRFFEAAFAAEPKLGDNLNAPHRYNAACAAAQAGCGQGKDADQTDQRERGRFRRQALVWLQAELVALRQLLEKEPDKARRLVGQQMQHWLEDKDFAGIRGSEALAELPEAERKEWRKLWTEVEALGQRAGEKAKKPAD